MNLMKSNRFGVIACSLLAVVVVSGCSSGPEDDKGMLAGMKSQGGALDLNKVPAAQRDMVRGIVEAGEKAHSGGGKPTVGAGGIGPGSAALGNGTPPATTGSPGG